MICIAEKWDDEHLHILPYVVEKMATRDVIPIMQKAHVSDWAPCRYFFAYNLSFQLPITHSATEENQDIENDDD